MNGLNNDCLIIRKNWNQSVLIISQIKIDTGFSLWIINGEGDNNHSINKLRKHFIFSIKILLKIWQYWLIHNSSYNTTLNQNDLPSPLNHK